jgi:ABC-type uncharacterized transport system permease subunit
MTDPDREQRDERTVDITVRTMLLGVIVIGPVAVGVLGATAGGAIGLGGHGQLAVGAIAAVLLALVVALTLRPRRDRDHGHHGA